jgi:hypothetical protein
VGWNLLLKVLTSKVVVDNPNNRVAEALLGDATGTVVMSARGAEQVELVSKPGTVLRLTKARVDMYRGSMRLCVTGPDGGVIEKAAEPDAAGVAVGPDAEKNNVSLLEFELVQADGVPFRPVDLVAEQAAKGAAAGKGGGGGGAEKAAAPAVAE